MKCPMHELNNYRIALEAYLKQSLINGSELKRKKAWDRVRNNALRLAERVDEYERKESNNEPPLCDNLNIEGRITVCSEPGGKGEACKTCEDYVIAYTPGCVPDGTYNGTQSGYDLTFIYRNNTYVAKTELGIRGINCPVTFHVVNGIIVSGNVPVVGDK